MKRLCFTLILCLALLTAALASEKNETQGDAHDVVVVGGGISGLTAAYDLKDHDIRVLEKRRGPGGRAFSLPHGGFVFACGAEYLGRLYGPLEKITKELNLTARPIPYPMDVYINEGRFYYGEMGRAILASKKVGLKSFRAFGKTIQKIYADYKEIPEFSADSPLARLDDISAHDWFKEMKFDKFFFEKYNVTFKGLFGANIHEISALSSLTEIAFDYENVNMDEEFSELSDLANDGTPGRFKTGAFSFDKGIAEIPMAIAALLGERFTPHAEVTSVEKDEDQFLITYTLGGKETVTITAESVVLATPAPVTLKIADRILSAEQKELLADVPYAPFITLALFSSEPIFDKGFDLAVPDNLFFTDIYDATWIPRFHNKDLQGEKTYITTVYIAAPSYQDRSILALSDAQILEKVFPDLEKVLPGAKAKVESHKIFRFEYGYPVMTKGAYKRLTRLHQITQAPVVLAGDYMIYPTLEAAADSGVLAAEKIREWLEE